VKYYSIFDLLPGRIVKITWGGQVRENILHLSPDEY